MNYSIKTKSATIKNLNSILNKEFDERNIKELLIDIREFIPELKVLREVADFIAHTSRNKGLCHSDIDLIYSKFKFRLPQDNPEKFDHKKISSELYKTLMTYGVEQINEEGLLNTTGLTKKVFQEIIKKNYKLRNKAAILENTYRHDDMMKGIKYLLDEVKIKTVFSQDEFISQFKVAVSSIQDFFSIADDYTHAIEDNTNDIMVCIISLLHDATIILFDGNVGKLKMAIVLDADQLKRDSLYQPQIGLNVNFRLEKNKNIDIRFNILSSNAKIIDYVENYKFEANKDLLLNEIYANRINNKLILTA